MSREPITSRRVNMTEDLNSLKMPLQLRSCSNLGSRVEISSTNHMRPHSNTSESTPPPFISTFTHVNVACYLATRYRQQDGTSVYNVDHETAPRDNPSYAHQQTGNGDLGQHQIDRRDTPGLGFANPQSAQATGQGYMKTDAPTMHPWTADIGPMEPLTFPAPHSSNSNAWQRGEADASNVSDLNAGRPPVSGNPEFTAGFRG